MHLRTLGRTCVALFAVSTLFPLVAGGIDRQRPLGWLGGVDVAVAAAVVCAAALLATRARGTVADADRVTAFRAIQAISGVVPRRHGSPTAAADDPPRRDA